MLIQKQPFEMSHKIGVLNLKISQNLQEETCICKITGFKLTVCNFIDPFVPSAPFLYPLKTENRKVF